MTWVSQSYYTGCGRFMERGSADPDPAYAPRPGVGYLPLALKMVVLPTMRSKYRSGVIQCPTKLPVGDRTSRFVIWGGASAQRVKQNNLSPDDGVDVLSHSRTSSRTKLPRQNNHPLQCLDTSHLWSVSFIRIQIARSAVYMIHTHIFGLKDSFSTLREMFSKQSKGPDKSDKRFDKDTSWPVCTTS